MARSQEGGREGRVRPIRGLWAERVSGEVRVWRGQGNPCGGDSGEARREGGRGVDAVFRQGGGGMPGEEEGDRIWAHTHTLGGTGGSRFAAEVWGKARKHRERNFSTGP